MGVTVDDAEQQFDRALHKVAKPLGLAAPPYDVGVRYEGSLFHHVFAHPEYLIPLDRPMMMVFKTVLGQEFNGIRIREGMLGDNFLFAISFFPAYLTNIYKRFGQDEQNMRAHVYDTIKELYERSRNPHVHEARNIIAANVPKYVECLHMAAQRLVESDTEFNAGMVRIEEQIAQQVREMPSRLEELF